MNKESLQSVYVENFQLNQGRIISLSLSFQLFGPSLGSAPIVLVNHALTGNSNVTGELGWWNKIIGLRCVIDIRKYTVLCINIPGNGYDGFLIDNFLDFCCDDIARLFLIVLDQLSIHRLYAMIGGSLGGSVGWHMLAHRPQLAKCFIPIGCDFKTTDWLHAICSIQEDLLSHPHNPIAKARKHAMTCYRTPRSLNERFKNGIDPGKGIRKSTDWLDFHGKSLEKRFSLQAYKMMNHLLSTIAAVDGNESMAIEKLSKIETEFHLISIDSDWLFPAFEIEQTHHRLKEFHNSSYYYVIHSIHGHDAFLIEYDQLVQILKKIFQ